MLKYVWAAVTVILVMWALVLSVEKTTNKIGQGFERDLSEISNPYSSKRVNPDDPLRGILGKDGILSNTGEAIVGEKNRFSKALGDIISTLIFSAIFVGVVIWWINRRKQ